MVMAHHSEGLPQRRAAIAKDRLKVDHSRGDF